RIKSITQRGGTEIDLFFDWKTDIVQTLQLVQATLSQLSLPPGAQIRNVNRLTFSVFPVLGYSLTSPVRDPATLRTIGEFTVRPPLARLPGVGRVAVAGGEVQEYHVNLIPERL